MQSKKERVFGLIGFPLSHSFSKKYFTEKFSDEGLKNHRYELFLLPSANDLPLLLAQHPNLAGLNVTIPHKQAVIPMMDEMEEEAATVGAVNVIKFKEGKLKGYNSDVYGFEVSLDNFLGNDFNSKALVLGTGGASKAVAFVLKKMKIPFKMVSRKEKNDWLTYEKLTPEIMAGHLLIVNCTPLGTHPNVRDCPDLPYESVTPDHYFYDLVYNPAETLFLKKGKAKGAHTINGLEMLHLQAKRSWEIWNDQVHTHEPE